MLSLDSRVLDSSRSRVQIGSKIEPFRYRSGLKVVQTLHNSTDRKETWGDAHNVQDEICQLTTLLSSNATYLCQHAN